MEDLARLGLLLTCLVAIYVGIRMLWVWRRTRKLPELAIGSNVLGIAIGGVLFVTLAALYPPPSVSPVVPFAIGLLGFWVHIAAQYVGIWKIFRAGERWPIPIVGVAMLLAGIWVISGIVDRDLVTWRIFLLHALRGVGLVWGVFECLRYSAALEKRAALGLADRTTAHRIWLWGVGGAAQVVVVGLEVASELVTGAALATTPMGLHVTSLLGLVGVGAIALAFFPPASYLGWISRRAESAGQPA